MKTLLLMRHAKSSWTVNGQPDRDRPLNERGSLDAPAMGAHLLRQNVCPDRIVSSSACRALTTARKVAQTCGLADDDVVMLDSLYHASPRAILDDVQALDDDEAQCILVVAHNPGMQE